MTSNHSFVYKGEVHPFEFKRHGDGAYLFKAGPYDLGQVHGPINGRWAAVSNQLNLQVRRVHGFASRLDAALFLADVYRQLKEE